MGYYISNMFGIRIGGVFAGRLTDAGMAEVKATAAKVVLGMRAEGLRPDLGGEDGDVSHCMSTELEAHKGSYVVIAGVFNYWNFSEASEFAKRLSVAFDTCVMHMAWNEEEDTMNCQVWHAGKPLEEDGDNPIGRAIEKVT